MIKSKWEAVEAKYEKGCDHHLVKLYIVDSSMKKPMANAQPAAMELDAEDPTKFYVETISKIGEKVSDHKHSTCTRRQISP